MVDDWQHHIGFVYGIESGVKQMGVQIAGIFFVIGLNVAMTSLICYLSSLVIALRLSLDELMTVDDAIHGEKAYAWSEV
ncbi:Ammonium transporter AmtB-like domain [Dillenia turbinata]|uniref:Ammonium transporter AmtB-like domain n=1 Tax=Dillenia turbinata TaxID=194707 RepID=A0AAN8VV53_9MAGN